MLFVPGDESIELIAAYMRHMASDIMINIGVIGRHISDYKPLPWPMPTWQLVD